MMTAYEAEVIERVRRITPEEWRALERRIRDAGMVEPASVRLAQRRRALLHALGVSHAAIDEAAL